MNAEIITSGTELLLGETVDTNSIYIARALREMGVNLYFKTSVGDNVERMALALRQALARADVVITTGGLGPTVDDVTREAVAAATGRQLVLNPACLAHMEALFARWGRAVSENNRRQVYLPEGSIPILNPVGTAPGFIVETEQGTIISLPGVPREMERLMQDVVLPYLKQRLGAEQAIIKARVLRTVSLPESWIDEKLDVQMRSANPTVGLSAHLGAVDIRITARAATEEEADRMIAEMEAEVRRRIGDEHIYGTGADRLEEVTGRLLAQAGVKLALLETATRGEIARLLRATPEGNGVLSAAHVADGPEDLMALLGISRAKIEAFGWVSEMVAAEAAALLIDTYQGGWGMAVLSCCGDEGDVYGENPGETWLALGTPDATIVKHYPYGGVGTLATRWVALRSLDVLRRQALAKLAAKGPSGSHSKT
ncbi:MAG: CinA family nicotinamide mononucleotide deamidase-related protein [Anaerolineae bacterium]